MFYSLHISLERLHIFYLKKNVKYIMRYIHEIGRMDDSFKSAIATHLMSPYSGNQLIKITRIFSNVDTRGFVPHWSNNYEFNTKELVLDY